MADQAMAAARAAAQPEAGGLGGDCSNNGHWREKSQWPFERLCQPCWNADILIVAAGHGENGVAIDVMPMVCQGHDGLVGPANVGSQLPNFGSQLPDFTRQRIYTLEQPAEPESPAQQEQPERNGNADQRVGLRIHKTPLIMVLGSMLAQML